MLYNYQDHIAIWLLYKYIEWKCEYMFYYIYPNIIIDVHTMIGVRVFCICHIYTWDHRIARLWCRWIFLRVPSLSSISHRVPSRKEVGRLLRSRSAECGSHIVVRIAASSRCLMPTATAVNHFRKRRRMSHQKKICLLALRCLFYSHSPTSGTSTNIRSFVILWTVLMGRGHANPKRQTHLVTHLCGGVFAPYVSSAWITSVSSFNINCHLVCLSRCSVSGRDFCWLLQWNDMLWP